MSSSLSTSQKRISFMDFPNSKVLLVSRLDGTRGPLGVAKAVHSRLADKYGCKLEEFFDFADVFKLIAEIPFKYKGYTICIHQNGFRLPMAFCWLSKLDKKNRYFLVVHGVAAEERKYRPVLQRDLKLEPKLIREFPNLICVSEFERGVLKRLYGREHGITVIGNGVDLSSEISPRALLAKKRSSYPPVIITTGGYEECKGCDLALLVLSRFARETGTRPRLIVCGRDTAAVGSNRSLCERIAQEGNVELDYRGEISDKKELLKLYQEADFYAGLSRFDTFNVSVLEGAAACCVPIISSSCGAVGLFSDESAVCCDIEADGWEKEVAATMIRLCDDDAHYREIASAARFVAEANTWDAISEKYWDALTGRD
mgnify:CR=1 FL=1